MNSALGDFVEQVSLCHTERQAGEYLLAFFQNHGLHGGNIWFAAGEDTDRTVNCEVSSYPSDWLEWGYQHTHNGELQLPKIVARETRPVRWGWDLDQHRYDKDHTDWRHAWTAFGEFGMRNSLIFPIPTKGYQGSSGVSCYSTEQKPQFDQLISERGSMFCIASTITHMRLQRFREQRSNSGILTNREKDCLSWLALGFSPKQIAHRMNISVHTVNSHLSNAKRKMSARTREQAVAKALLSGEITL